MNASVREHEKRTGIVIITELYNLTGEMVKQSRNPDFLIESVDKRQLLMDEYDAYKANHPYEDTTPIMEMVREMVAMDKRINASLLNHRNDAKERLTSSQSKQKAAGYAANYVSSSGSYMNYKK